MSAPAPREARDPEGGAARLARARAVCGCYRCDAQAWAGEFCRLHGGDEGLMLTWFANAMMTGYDEGRRAR